MTKKKQKIWFIDSKKKINSWQQSSNLVKETGNFSRLRPSFTLGQAEVSFKAVTENGWNKYNLNTSIAFSSILQIYFRDLSRWQD